MLLKRVIPVLLLSKRGLYKTINFTKRKYVGDPINTVRLFNDLGADEIIIIDIDATKEQRGADISLIRDLASECFMPLTYAGGISSITDAEEILRMGVEKLCINNAITESTALIEDLSKEFGSSTIVISVDVKTNMFKKTVYSYKKNKSIKKNIIDYVQEIAFKGAGEIFLTNVDYEGTQRGFDYSLIKEVSESVNIPVIAHGGCGNFKNIEQAFDSGASAVACGSKFVYSGPHNAVLINYISEDEYNILNFNKDN